MTRNSRQISYTVSLDKPSTSRGNEFMCNCVMCVKFYFEAVNQILLSHKKVSTLLGWHPIKYREIRFVGSLWDFPLLRAVSPLAILYNYC